MCGTSSLEMGGISIESYGQERIEKKVSIVRPVLIKKTGLKIKEGTSLKRGKNGSSNLSPFRGRHSILNIIIKQYIKNPEEVIKRTKKTSICTRDGIHEE